jgi:hypothetical protein
MAHLRTLTCNADVIVIGKVHIFGPSHYNAAKTGIYRDIDFDPSVVLRDNPNRAAAQHSAHGSDRPWRHHAHRLRVD